MHIFFSDAHLGLGSREKSREREHAVVRFLEWVGTVRPEALYIVGDLFDYWFDYRTVIPKEFIRTVGAIAKLTDAGIPIEYVIGNHDFGHRDFFEGELGVRVHHDDIERTIAGRRAYISHGDGKAFNDTGYLILKKVLRAPISNRLFRIIPPDIGIGAAMYASRRSRAYTDKKHYDVERPGETDGLRAFAERKIREDGFNLVVMGHTHRPLRLDFEGGTYINLGTWLRPEHPYLVVDEQGIDLKHFVE